MAPATLTKSLFTGGVQCHKLLWWRVHEPNAVELQPDTVLQDLFDQGRQVGEPPRTRVELQGTRTSMTSRCALRTTYFKMLRRAHVET